MKSTVSTISYLKQKGYLNSQVIVLCKDEFFGKGNFKVHFFTAIYKPSSFPPESWTFQAATIRTGDAVHFYEEGHSRFGKDVPVVIVWHKDDECTDLHNFAKITYFAQEIAVRAAVKFAKKEVDATDLYRFSQTDGTKLHCFHWNHYDVRRNIQNLSQDLTRDIKSLLKVEHLREVKIQQFIDDHIDLIRYDFEKEKLIESTEEEIQTKIRDKLRLLKGPKQLLYKGRIDDLPKIQKKKTLVKKEKKEEEEEEEEEVELFFLSSDEEEKEEEETEPFTYVSIKEKDANPCNPNMYTGIDPKYIGTSLSHLKTKPDNPIAKTTTTSLAARRKFSCIPQDFGRKSINEALNWRNRVKLHVDENPDFNDQK